MTMPDELSRELRHSVDGLPAPRVASSLWAEGRALRGAERRQALIASVVTALLVCGLFMFGRPLLPAGLPVAAPEPGGALPQHLYLPTGPAASWGPDASGLERDLTKLGRISAATWTGYGIALLVGADDGRHHLTALPGMIDPWLSVRGPLEVSPDGWHLAYAWADLAKSTDDTRAGLAIVDLRDGSERHVELKGRNGRPVRVESISWSENGTRLGWTGDEAVQWDESSASWKGNIGILGGTTLDDLVTAQRDVKGAAEGGALAVDNEGVLRLLLRRKLWTLRPTGGPAALTSRVVAAEALPWSRGVVSPDGRLLVVGVNGPDFGMDDVSGLRQLDLAAASSRLVNRGSWPATDPGSWTEPLGWSPSGDLVVGEVGGSIIRNEPYRVYREHQAETLELVTSDGGTAVSVATDLADTDPVAFAEPRWPISDERKALLVILSLASLVGVGYLVRWGWRRRRLY